jgi:hypothetical protein
VILHQLVHLVCHLGGFPIHILVRLVAVLT